MADDPPPSPRGLQFVRDHITRTARYVIDGVEHVEYEWDRQLAADKQAEAQQGL